MYLLRKWMHSYRLMVRWQALRFKPVLPLVIIVQVFIGVGGVIGLGYMYPNIDPKSALYLATGAPTLTLIALGMSIMPQMLAEAKSQGAFEYMWSLPIPRLAFLTADLTIWLVAVLPGVIGGLWVGSHQYHFELSINPLVVLAIILVALTSTVVGYTLAQLSPKAELTVVITNFITFCLFLFSPINFPVERLPEWLADLHQFLPIKYSADVIRGTLTTGYSENLTLSFSILVLWLIAGFGVTYLLITRRR